MKFRNKRSRELQDFWRREQKLILNKAQNSALQQTFLFLKAYSKFYTVTAK